MPVAIDQRYNMRKVEKEGWGHVLHWEDLTHEKLRDHIRQLLNDKRLENNIYKIHIKFTKV